MEINVKSKFDYGDFVWYIKEDERKKPCGCLLMKDFSISRGYIRKIIFEASSANFYMVKYKVQLGASDILFEKYEEDISLDAEDVKKRFEELKEEYKYKENYNFF